MQNENGKNNLTQTLSELSLEAARSFACCPEDGAFIPKYECSDEYLRLALKHILGSDGAPEEWKEAVRLNENLNNL